MSRALSLFAVAAFALGSVACSAAPGRSSSTADAAAPVRTLVSCPGGSVGTPEQAAAFYGCEIVEGDLRIQRSELLDLGAFAELREITGSVVVEQNPKLRSLEGLESLSSVGALTIADNPKLESVRALEALTVAGSVTITDNPELRSLSGLDGLGRLERLELRDNGIRKTTGLGGLESVGALVIRKNDQLISLAGLANLRQVRSLEVSENPRVCAKLGLFPRLAEVRDEMSVTRNFGLSAADLDALRARVRRGGAAGAVALSAPVAP